MFYFSFSDQKKDNEGDEKKTSKKKNIKLISRKVNEGDEKIHKKT